MTSFTDTWNAGYEAIPPDSENASQGAGRIRAERRDIRERLEVDHSWAGTADDGKHKFITLLNQTSDPTIATGESSLFGKVVSGFTRVFVRNSLSIKDIAPPGEIRMGVWTTAPSGWLLCVGGTIGDATSGGTARSNADTQALFTLLWEQWSNTAATVSSGRGGSAAADFAAHKTIVLPDFRGRAPVGVGLGLTAEGGGPGTVRTIGDLGGAERHTLVTGELAVHAHAQAVTTVLSGVGGAGAQGGAQRQVGGVTASEGGGGAHNNMSPFIAISFIISL